MAVNKVVYSGDTLIDISDTTADESSVVKGKIFYKANGERATGAAEYQPKITTISFGTSWSGSGPYTQIVTVTGATANSKVDLQPDATILNQLATDGVTALYVVNDGGVFTVYAAGAAPTVTISMQATIEEVIV